ncbi:hypothetical protein K2173_000878 [Erythroxylum novogranatense]|uniref:Aminotransferase class V domain-containing protein n=1 Tax=Erythroxylum novogranatense TaxID=1862640 RepID=A0AAV8TSD7_9ROSI|nr:hypothetical protein K2173_000878 [Erythroxylum novogranatense]
MELEQPILEESVQKLSIASVIGPGSSSTSKGRSGSSSFASSHLCSSRSESIRTLDMGVPKSINKNTKVNIIQHWLRSQIIGDDVEFGSPFVKRTLTYVDHTASARSLRCIENFVTANVLPFYVGHRTTKMTRQAINYIKSCLGDGRDDAIMFYGSGSTAAIKRLQEVMGISVPSTLRERVLKCLSNEERWVVFHHSYDQKKNKHHSNILSWRQSLAEVIEIGLDENGLIDIEDLMRKLDMYKYANRPILGSFSACNNVSGICSDTRTIVRLLHQFGGFAFFDFACEIDMRSGEVDGYDAIFLSPHKFLGGPGSPGILLMSKVLYQLKSSPPSTCGGGTVDYVNGFDEKDTLYLEDIEERENGGTPQIIQTIRAALAFWEEKYITRAIDRLLPNKNIQILGNTSAKRQAIMSFLIWSTSNSPNGIPIDGLYMWGETGSKRDKPLRGPFVAVLLNDLFGIQARGGCACAGPYGHKLLNIDKATSLPIRCAIEKRYVGVKPRWTRVSFPYYMSNEMTIYGQRFLPLYSFNWKSGSWCLKKKAFQDLKGKETRGVRDVLRPLVTTTQAKVMEDNKIKANRRPEKNFSKCDSYLDFAKSISILLPKFPDRRRIPKDIDINLLHFRV